VNHQTNHEQVSWKQFIPLIIVFILIILFTITRQLRTGWNLSNAMFDFMGSFFIIFGALKLIKLSEFVDAYRSYDWVARYSKPYAYIYPFLELSLGLAYLTRTALVLTNSIVLLLMVISSVGVLRALRTKQSITCACLGTIFKLPMTYVTLLENVLMGVMALAMLLF
jgi:hypothetical protein